MVSLQGFSAADGLSVAALWRRSAPADPITDDRFTTLVLLDPNFDPAGLRLAFRGEQLVGAACAMRRRTPLDGIDLDATHGWITFFLVAPDARGQGIGSALVQDAVDWLGSHGVTDVDFSGYTPNYFLPGIDPERYATGKNLLERHQFGAFGTADAMARSLDDYAMPDAAKSRQHELEAAGYAFETPTASQLVWLIALAREQFSADWGRAIREAIAAGVDREHIIIATDPGRQIVGWAMFGAYERLDERFGPFGVLESQRGTGIGWVLMHLTLTRMRARGERHAWFLWADQGTVAHELYIRAGFTVTRRFALMCRQRPSSSDQPRLKPMEEPMEGTPQP